MARPGIWSKAVMSLPSRRKCYSLLDDPALRVRMGVAGRRHVETCFSTAAASAAHTGIYEDLLRLS